MIDWSKRKTKDKVLKEKEDAKKETEYQIWLAQKQLQKDLDNRAEYKRLKE